MPRTVEYLKRQALAAQSLANEKKAALVKMRAVCAKYGFSAEDLYPLGHWPGDELVGDVHQGLPKNVVRLAAPATYRSARGEVWSGRGRRPNWLNEALAEGASLEDFKVT